MPFLLLTLLLALAGAGPLSAQIVELEGAERDTAAVLVREVVARGNYIVIDRDTVLGAEVALPGDLVVVDARVALEGSVAGSVVVIRADFFARPGSRVGGRILVLSGGAFPSARAETGEVVYLDPRVETRVEAQDRGYALRLVETLPGVLRLPGILGFQLPTYDRVDGASIRWDGGLGFGRDTATIALIGSAAWRTERERLNAGVELRVRPSPRARISLSVSRATRTNDRWIRGDFANSLSALLGRSDVRNYYESDEARVALVGLPAPPLLEGEEFVAPSVVLRLSEDRSLPAGSPWSLLGRDDAWRPNPPIDEGLIGSATLGAIFGWRGIVSRAAGSAAVEWAPAGIGDFTFAQLRAHGLWSTLGPYNHPIEVEGFLSFPVGGGDVPRQRWAMLGGPGTLPTFDTGSMLGDRAVFVRGSWLIPLRPVTLPLVGIPALRFEYAAGTAWATGDPRPPLEQNVGAGLQLLFLTGTVQVDPARSPLDPIFSFGAELPLGGIASVF